MKLGTATASTAFAAPGASAVPAVPAAPAALAVLIASAVGLVLVVVMAAALGELPGPVPSAARTSDLTEAPYASGADHTLSSGAPGVPRELRPHRVQGPAGTGLVTPQDTINGDPITDPGLVARIERVAASLPAQLLALQPRSPAIRYVAQAFGGGDQAPVFSAVFADPAAALSFGCAFEEDRTYACEIVPATVAPQPYEELPGIRCVPMQLAVGAAAFEPDRCEASG